MYLTLENDMMALAKEIKYITGVCCGAWSENIACLWQRIALKTASAWSVWNPCVTVSITKTLHSCFFWKRTSSILKEIQGFPNVLFAFRPSTRELCIRVTLQRGHENVHSLGHEPGYCKDSECGDIWAAQLSCNGAGPWFLPSPGAPGVLHRWCCAALGFCRAVVGWGDLSVTEWKPSGSLFPMGLIWFACRRQDVRTCIMHEGRVISVWCPLAFRSVTQC